MSTEQEVIKLVARKTRKPKAKITPEKTFHDLGIDGDDAVELIAELCKRYEVPAEEVDLRKYIGPEGAFTVANHVFNAVARKGGTELKELKIGDLNVEKRQGGEVTISYVNISPDTAKTFRPK